MTKWPYVVAGGIVMALIFRLTSAPIPAGVDPNLRNQDILACQYLQSGLQRTKADLFSSNNAKMNSYPGVAAGRLKSQADVFDMYSKVQMSPRIRDAYNLVIVKLTSIDSGASLEQTQSAFVEILDGFLPQAEVACSHVTE